MIHPATAANAPCLPMFSDASSIDFSISWGQHKGTLLPMKAEQHIAAIAA